MTGGQRSPKIKNLIEQNRVELSNMLTGTGTIKRLNNLNWVRHELSYTEPRILFMSPSRDQRIFLDYNNMKNIGEAYDYILAHPHADINAHEICKIHSILCSGTHIMGGLTRSSDKILEITVNGIRYHAPDSQMISTMLNDIVYKINNNRKDTLTRAFDAHYEIIALQPFDDFNKRTARMIMNWILINDDRRPIMFNKPSDRQKYRAAISAMFNGNRKAYMQYMTETLLRSQKEIIKQIKTSRII